MPVNAPSFGTGAVDWGSYVNPNQQTIDADRAQTAQYIQGLPSAPTGGTTPQSPDVAHWFNSPNAASFFNPSAPSAVTAPATTNPFDQSMANSALATPTGFEALFNQSKQPPGSTVPPGSLPPNPYGAGQDTQWDAALTGQNAQAIKAPPTPTASATPTKAPVKIPPYNNPVGRNPGVPLPSPWQSYRTFTGGQP